MLEERRRDRAGKERRRDSLSPEQWGEIILTYLEAPAESGFIPLPFPTLTTAMGGGILPGELMLISGYTNHGKSVIADQLLDMAAQHGMRGHLYMTEMTAAQRGLRLISRKTGVPFGRLRSRSGITNQQWKEIFTELERMPYGVSVVSDWDIEDVVRDALRARFDLVVIDLIHGFSYDDERGLDRLSKAAQRLARVSTTREGHPGTAVVIVAHLSGGAMAGSKTPQRPKPGLHSLKGSTSLQQDPDFVLFVWQQDNEQERPRAQVRCAALPRDQPRPAEAHEARGGRPDGHLVDRRRTHCGLPLARALRRGILS
jgi:replicative DNA helicase